MRITLRLLATVSLLAAGSLARPARADITHYQDGRLCAGLSLGCLGKGPVALEQGETRVINVMGQNVNFCSGVSVSGSGVTVTVAGTKLVADGASVGTGQIDLRFALTGTATPGNRNVTLGNCMGANFTLTITVLRNGTATAMAAIPKQSTFFTTVDVTLTGTNIANAGAKVSNTNTNPNGTVTASILSSDATSATVRLTFSTAQAHATGRLVLFDNAFPTVCVPGSGTRIVGCYGAGIDFEITGPNVVESITFPTGSRLTPGSVLTIRIKLAQPAPSASTREGITLAGSITGSGGEPIRWQVHPSAVFQAEPGTTFSPTVELNNFSFPAGTQTRDFIVRLVSLPPGCNIECTGTIEARTADFRDAAPFKRTASFRMALQ